MMNSMCKIASIYCITNLINNKKYIGFSIDINHRVNYHFSGKSRCPHLTNAIKFYGKENFKWEIIYQSKEIEYTLNIMETYFIKTYNTLDPLGYNLTLGGEGSLNRIYSNPEKTKIKMSEVGKQRWNDKTTEEKETCIKNLDTKGLKHSDLSKEKQKRARKLWWERLTKDQREVYLKNHLEGMIKNRHNFYQKDKRYKQKTCKPIIFNGVQYESLHHASEETSRSRTYIKRRCTYL